MLKPNVVEMARRRFGASETNDEWHSLGAMPLSYSWQARGVTSGRNTTENAVRLKRVWGIVAAATVAGSALAADVGVSVSVGDPGFYGRIDVGNLPPPALVYAQPIVVERAPGAIRQPLYLRVPPGHAKHWNKHCRRYDACGYPVYFVQDRWYTDVYVPRYRRGGAAVVAMPDAAVAAPPVAYRVVPAGRYFVVPVMSVRAVVGPPDERCWVERQQVVEERSDAPNVPGAIAGAVIGGVLGHQVGGGRGKDIATVGGAVAGAAVGANVGRGGTQVYSQDVQRCARAGRRARPEYWDVTYRFRGMLHRAQLATPPGRTITVDANGEPRA